MDIDVTTGTGNEIETQIGPQLIRITNHLKMSACVAFALKFLDAHEDRPLLFHTLPATQTSLSATENQDTSDKKPAASKSSVTSAIPRLISVVEIVKREFVKSLALKHSTRLAGLHQYNEIGCLEDLDTTDKGAGPEEDRAMELAMALNGKNYVKQKQTPYMKITLSHSTLPELVEKGATYQPPTLRKLTKSAKARVKKRERKAKHSNEETAGSITGTEIPG